MNGCAYVEIYVKDRIALINYFSKGFGLEVVAEAASDGRHSTLLRSASIQLVITVPMADDSPVASWLDQHGEGIADVALYHQQITTATTAAMTEGSPVFTPPRRLDEGCFTATIGGAGSVRHTLVDPGDSTRPIAPPGRPWTWRTQEERRNAKVRAIDHVVVVVPPNGLSNILKFYAEAFGFAAFYRQRITIGRSRWIVCATWKPEWRRFCIVFAEPVDGRNGLSEFLESHNGSGVKRVAFLTERIIPTVEELRRRGVTFELTPARYYLRMRDRMFIWPHVIGRVSDLRANSIRVSHDHGGLVWQARARSPHIPRAVEYEIVQRDGGLGFGIPNDVELQRALDADIADMERHW
jgi:4-hydroxymandelate synthase